MVVRDGRFGPYVTDGETNASLRRGDAVEEVTLERAAELLADRRARGPAVKKAPAAQDRSQKAPAKKRRGEEGRAKKVAATKAPAKKAAVEESASSSPAQLLRPRATISHRPISRPSDTTTYSSARLTAAHT